MIGLKHCGNCGKRIIGIFAHPIRRDRVLVCGRCYQDYVDNIVNIK